MHSDDLLSAGEAARLSGLSIEHLRRLAREGSIPAVRTPGNHRRFKRSDVEALLRPEPAAEVG